MKLTRLITLNWSNLESREWQLADMTLLVGESGSGKTTLLDAIQTILTATRGGVFFYNPGQDETTQGSRIKEKRTLPDYCLGRENTAFARDSAHTYLAAVFEPSDDEEEMPFTAVMAMESLVVGNKGELKRLGLFLIRRRVLTLEHFLSTDSNGDGALHVIETSDFWPHLQRKLGRDAVEYFHDDKGQYLRHLYGAFRGMKHVDEQEAVRAARSLVKAMAYKPAGSIDELVKYELLEEDEGIGNDLQRVGELLRDMRDLADEATRLTESITKLKTVRSEGERTLELLGQQLTFEAAKARRTLARDEDEKVRKLADIAHAKQEIEKLAKQATLFTSHLAKLAATENQLRARLDKIPAWNQKQEFEGRVAEAERRVGTAIAVTTSWLDGLAKLVEEGTLVERLDAAALATSVAQTRATVAGLLGQARRFSAKRLATVLESLPGNQYSPDTAAEAADQVGALKAPAEALLDALVRGETNFATSLEHEIVRLDHEYAERKNCEEAILAELKNLSEGRSAVPEPLQRGLDLLNAHMPQAHAKVLCELVEPKPGSPWQNAIEGFMGGDRFAVVVEETSEAAAIDFVRHKLEPRQRLKIVQGRRARRDAKDAPPGSILEELSVGHPVAVAYLKGAFGSVVKVPSIEVLRSTSRGITQEGHAAASFGMFVAFQRDDQLVFGVEARRRRQKALEAELVDLRGHLQRIQQERANQKALAARLRKLSLPGNPEEADNVWALCQERHDALEALARIDLTEATELQAELDKLLEQRAAVDRQLEDARTSKARFEVKRDDAEKRVKELDAGFDLLRAAVANADAQLTFLEEASGHRLVAQTMATNAAAISADKGVSESSITAKAASLGQDIVPAYTAFTQALGAYNLKARDVERVSFQHARLQVTDFEQGVTNICATLQELDRQLKQQENIGIAQNVERLEQAQNTFNHVFTSDFCFRIRSKVANGVETLRELNRELEHLVFGGDRFTIDWTWVPQYQDYHRFFEAVHARAEEFGQRNIFDADVLEADLARVRDELKTLLLSSDREVAQKRLKELADYRNYRRYEIYREGQTGGRIALSTWGTGSGGQLETPFYLVRSAVLSSAFRFFSKDRTRLRLMVSDEAFAKMDESRRRSVIHYLREKLGVQLIVAMPTANAAAVKPEFEKEFTFARVAARLADGRTWFAFEAQEKTLKRSALVARWDVAETEARARARAEFEQRYPGALSAEAAVANASSDHDASASATQSEAAVDLGQPVHGS